jgi:hypothetical protein
MAESAQKVGGRWQVEVRAPDADAGSGTSLTFTRKGVEITGWYDHICGIGDGWTLTWSELDDIKRALYPDRPGVEVTKEKQT